jgi:hypothetical protein
MYVCIHVWSTNCVEHGHCEYVCVYVSMYTHQCRHAARTTPHMHTHTHTYTCTKCRYKHTNIHTHTHKHTHTHTYTHRCSTRSNSSPPRPVISFAARSKNVRGKSTHSRHLHKGHRRLFAQRPCHKGGNQIPSALRPPPGAHAVPPQRAAIMAQQVCSVPDL